MADSSPSSKSKGVDEPTSTQVAEKSENWFIGSIDQGTTSTRFFIFNAMGTPVASHQIEFKQMYPHPGWVNSG